MKFWDNYFQNLYRFFAPLGIGEEKNSHILRSWYWKMYISDKSNQEAHSNDANGDSSSSKWWTFATYIDPRKMYIFFSSPLFCLENTTDFLTSDSIKPWSVRTHIPHHLRIKESFAKQLYRSKAYIYLWNAIPDLCNVERERERE